MGLVPCELCWYQRVLMYPLVVVLGVATWEGRQGVYRTVLPLSVLGAGIAAYHSYLQLTADAFCSFGGSCAIVQYCLPVLGLSIPNLSFVGFVLVSALVVAARYSASAGSTTSPVSG